jgi:hypothetical protein
MVLLSTLKMVKRHFYFFIKYDKYSVLFLLMLSIYVVQLFSIKAYTLFGTYIDTLPMIYIGILYAVNLRFKYLLHNYEREKVNSLV